MRLIRQGYGEFTRQRAIGPARWPHHDLFFVHAGRIELEFPSLGQGVTLGPQAGVLIWPHTPFRGRVRTARARASIQHFRVEGEGPVPLAGLARQRHGFSRQAARRAAWVAACVRRALEGPDESGAGRLTPLGEARLTLILLEGGFLAAPEARAAPRRLAVEELREWMRANLARNLAIPDLARHAGLSPSRFREVFLAEQGLTAGEFLRQLRADEARRLLAETDQPLKQIAAVLGFADAVVFHRAFKARTGLTPGAFRRRNRIVG